MKMQKTKGRQLRNIHLALEEELSRLKRLLPCGEALTVRWKPRPLSKISGKVAGDTIYVYDEDPREALNTLKHEYIDCLLTRSLVIPLVTLVNTFVKLREKEIYERKERIVTDLIKLI